MAMNFFKEKLFSNAPQKGPLISIAVRRSQVSFSKEAAELMKLEVGKSFVEIGYDDEGKQMGFKVFNEASENRAEVKNLHVKAKKEVDVPVIYIGSYLKEIPEIPRDTSARYPLYSSNGYFFINLNEAMKKIKPQPRQKKDS